MMVKEKIYIWMLVLLCAIPSLLCAADGKVNSDSAMVAYLRSEGVAITEGNRVCVLKSGADKFDDLFMAIRKAKH